MKKCYKNYVSPMAKLWKLILLEILKTISLWVLHLFNSILRLVVIKLYKL